MPTDIAIIDTSLNLPLAETSIAKGSWGPLLMDDESKGYTRHPARHLYADVPQVDRGDNPAEDTMREMDRFGIERALLNLTAGDEVAARAITDHPDRLMGCWSLDPNRGMAAVRDLQRAYEELGVRAAHFFPCGGPAQVPINDKRAFPVYAKCVELDIPIFVQAGVPGPRVPMDAQYVGLVDEVCWFFPELTFVFRHGCEPWTELAVKLMVKWPNLYFSTSAFAPKYYPKDIIDYANTRGADKVIYAGYYPHGLTLDRIFSEMPDVPFRDHVWPKFLRENAARILKI
jgi:predicted TIM-barrel fold metal-dependent hydrolase